MASRLLSLTYLNIDRSDKPVVFVFNTLQTLYVDRRYSNIGFTIFSIYLSFLMIYDITFPHIPVNIHDVIYKHPQQAQQARLEDPPWCRQC